jgi:metal-dependent amidase/aminoacylase/carboxypeptidase family protein
MMPSPVLADLMDANLSVLGLTVTPPEDKQRMGSTDMGNVSQVVPGLHPYMPIAGEGVAGHTEAFAEASKSPMAHEGLIQAAKALAMTAVDLLSDPALVEAAWAAFREQKAELEA